MSRRPLFPPVFRPTISHPLVDDFTLRAARLRARQQPANVPSAYPLRMRNHPMWTGNNELGNEVGFAPDGNNRQMVLKVDEWGFPETWKVMLGSTYDLPAIGSAEEQRWKVRAEVEVGTGGAVQQFYVDWMEGTVFNVVGNAIVVNAVYNDVIADPGNAPVNLRLRATVGIGKSGAASLPTATESFAVTAGGVLASPLIRIPPFTRYISFVDRVASAAATSIFAATTFIRMYPTTAGATFAIGGVTGAQALAMGNRVPIPAIARALLIENAGAGDINANAIFSVEP